MKRLFIFMCLLVLPAVTFAQSYNIIKAKADIKSGTISGTVNEKPFTYSFKGDGHTFILYENWFPALENGKGYKLELTLPKDFTAIAEADKAEHTKYGWAFTLDHPDGGMVIGFSDKWILKTQNYKGTELAVYFNKDNISAADDYFNRIKDLMSMYSDMLGSYPYGRFAVADVPFPVGHALVSLTFISEQIVKMPFLTGTSLGHELLHQWFGVSVAADRNKGNWAEGLTTYLADRLYEKQKNKDMEYRKNAIINIMENARQKEKGTELAAFRYNKDNFSQAVGYSKGLMVFSMLEDMTGNAFQKGIKQFYSDYKFKTATWGDIQKEIEKASGKNLDGFFKGWLNEPEIADFDIKDIDVKARDGGFETSFKIDNKYEALQYPLEIVIKTETDTVSKTVYVSKKEETFTISTDSRPVSFAADPQFKTARVLDMKEMKPVLYALYSKYPKAIFVNPAEKAKYALVIDSLENAEVYDDTANPYKYNDKTLVFLGRNNRAYEKYFGTAPQISGDFAARAILHPLYADRMAYLINGTDAETIGNFFPRVKHYGKYAEVAVVAGHLVMYDNKLPDDYYIPLKNDKQGVRVQEHLSLKDIIEENPYAKVIYVGETHDQYAHHQNQLAVIKTLTEDGKQIAVGLEMIQKPFQKYLDQYVAGTIDEKKMLIATEYYDRWRFDFRLYRPIFQYARDHKIPLVALNTPQELTEKVADKGIMNLSDEDKKLIPVPFEYTGGDYRDRLYDIFMQHNNSNFENFYEAQLLWDETMAQSAYEYMQANPNRMMVIVAGNGHIRYKSAIPERLFRRNQLNYYTILQDEDDVKGIGDYVLYPDALKYQHSPKLGVALDDGKELVVKEVVKDSAAEKAGIKKDDVIISYNGTQTAKFSDLKLGLLYSDTDKDYSISVRRDGKTIDLKVRF